MNSCRKIGSKIVWLAFLVIAFKSLTTRLVDTDLWWHLAVGQHLVETKTFLKTDIFSHSLYGSEWINFEWLGQVVFYSIAKWFGLDALFYLKIILSFTVLLILTRAFFLFGARGPWLLLTCVIGFVILRPRLNERIELFSLIFLAVYIFLMYWSRTQNPAYLRSMPWIFSALMVFWCNLHGGFIYGLGLMALFFVGAYWSGERVEVRSMFGRALIFSGFATLLNPYGPKLYMALFHHILQFRNGLSLIEEWAPPSIMAAPVFWLVFVTTAFVLSMGLIKGYSEAKFWAPLVVIFLIWASASYRNMVLIVFSSIPFLVTAFSQWKQFHYLRSHLGFQRSLWGLLGIFWIFQTPLLAKSFPKEKIQWNRFPTKACDFVLNNQISGTMYNSYEFGGYLSWCLGKEYPVFMDGRYLFYPIIKQHMEMNDRAIGSESSQEWQLYLARNKFDYAITNHGEFSTPNGQSSLEIQFPRSHWALIYWDDTACIFINRDSKDFQALRSMEYKYLLPYNLVRMQSQLENKELGVEDIREELRTQKVRVGFTVIGSEMEKMFHVD